MVNVGVVRKNESAGLKKKEVKFHVATCGEIMREGLTFSLVV